MKKNQPIFIPSGDEPIISFRRQANTVACQGRHSPELSLKFIPLIGITCEENKEQKLYQSSFALSQAISYSGAFPLLLNSAISGTALKKIIEFLNGIIIAGGAFDIHPSFYNEKKKYRIDSPQMKRTQFEIQLIQKCIRLKKPVLGICGGMQAINVALGGNLYQDIVSELPYAKIHEQKIKKDKPSHFVNITKNSKLSQMIHSKRIKTNSSHHQAVKDIGENLIISAFADDGIVEAIEGSQNNFIMGVQWHPEVLKDKKSAKFFRKFIEICKISQKN